MQMMNLYRLPFRVCCLEELHLVEESVMVVYPSLNDDQLEKKSQVKLDQNQH